MKAHLHGPHKTVCRQLNYSYVGIGNQAYSDFHTCSIFPKNFLDPGVLLIYTVKNFISHIIQIASVILCSSILFCTDYIFSSFPILHDNLVIYFRIKKLFVQFSGVFEIIHDHTIRSMDSSTVCSQLFCFNLHNGGWSPNWVHSARRPLTGLLYLPRVIVRMENLVEWMAVETEVLGGNLPRCHFVHHRSHLTRPGIEPGPPRWEASD
jgi:hypothetical protein